MKTIREFLEEQINEQLIQAVVSGRRTGEGPSKVKLRPVELKGQIFYQASMTEGTKVYHKNFTREEMKRVYQGIYVKKLTLFKGELSASGNRTQSGWKYPYQQERESNHQNKTTRACTE